MTFGGSGITDHLFNWIRKHLPEGKHILELGSGDVSTLYLSRFYRMTSVEDNAEFVDKHSSHYIHAPLVDGWYDTTILRTLLPRDYDLLLVDGPAGSEIRRGFIRNFSLFKTDVPIIIDDTWRAVEKQMAVDLAANSGYELIEDQYFCILLPPAWASGKH